MPLYEYQCESCGRRFEKIRKFSDPPVDTCPTCGGPVHKLVSSPAFQLKGTGWYATDYSHQGKGQSPDGDKSDPASAPAASDADKSSKTSKDSTDSKDSRDSRDSKDSKASKDSKGFERREDVIEFEGLEWRKGVQRGAVERIDTAGQLIEVLTRGPPSRDIAWRDARPDLPAGLTGRGD